MPTIARKRSPLYRLARDAGATFVDHAGWSIPDVYAGTDVELTAASIGVVLLDDTPNGKLQVEGAAAETAVTATFQLPTLAIGESVQTESARVVRLRPDLFYLAVSPGEVTKTLAKMRSGANDSFVTCTDITHGRAEIRVIGPRGPELMSKVCGLDFANHAFPDGHALQSSVAKTNQLIIRSDLGELPAYSLIGGRSLGAYLWSVLMEAGMEWDIQPIGRSAHRTLEESAS